MKNLSLIVTLFAATLLLVFNGCTPDEPPPVPVGPALSLSSEAGFVSDTATVEIGAEFKVKLTADQGDEVLTRIEVKENGVTISDLTRITFAGFPAGSNPSPIESGSANGFTWEIGIIAQTDEDVTHTYTITVTDQASRSDEVSVDVTTFKPGTPVTEMTMILLLNQGGPAGTGGLDLHTGTGVGSVDTTADIKDNGIDILQPVDKNWKQKISPVNGSDLRVPAVGFVYDSVLIKEEILEAFNAGTSITTSDVVEVGDQFLVLSKGTYFALIVTKINITTTDNGDYYEFSVKM